MKIIYTSSCLLALAFTPVRKTKLKKWVKSSVRFRSKQSGRWNMGVSHLTIYTLCTVIRSHSRSKHSFIGRIRAHLEPFIHSIIQSLTISPLYLWDMKIPLKIKTPSVIISFITLHSLASSPPNFVIILEYTKTLSQSYRPLDLVRFWLESTNNDGQGSSLTKGLHSMKTTKIKP